jgi:SAM-dependent methyltransferase
MTGFSADWLAMREPFDHAARSASAASLDLAGAAIRLRSGHPTLNVLDLACGTGTNLRELAPLLGGSQRWTLIDHDPRLLATLPGALRAWAREKGFEVRTTTGGLHVSGPDWDAKVRPRRMDLALALKYAPFDGVHLVTASALLDLVSGTWLALLVFHAFTRKAAMFFALSVDGRATWEPSLPGDAEIDSLFAAHQLRDKGFGAALGGTASSLLMRVLPAMDYTATQAASDWVIDARDGSQAVAMITAMIEGASVAALEQDPSAAALVSDWKARRLALAGETRLIVGHQDILALP